MHVHVGVVPSQQEFGKDAFPSFVLSFSTSLFAFALVGLVTLILP